MVSRSLRVAGIQVSSQNGLVEENLSNATHLVEQVVRQRAQLILCPELMLTGYTLHRSIWSAAEPIGGPTEIWLERMARVHQVFIGAGYLEADGEDLFNTFTLMEPGGKLAGRVRKHSPGFLEGWFFRSGSEPRVIETALGRLGVGICFDNYTGRFFEEMQAEEIDLLLMPHSSPVPVAFPPIAKAIQRELLDLAPFFSQALGVPAVLVNKAGPNVFRTPLPPLPLPKIRLAFEGGSTICGSDGVPLARLGVKNGVVISDVILDPARKVADRRAYSGYWSVRPRRLPRVCAALHRLLAGLGGASYYWSQRRRHVANLISRREGGGFHEPQA
jgi:N-carbamoylputrescine amidase